MHFNYNEIKKKLMQIILIKNNNKNKKNKI